MNSNFSLLTRKISKHIFKYVEKWGWMKFNNFAFLQTNGYFRFIDGWRMIFSRWGENEPSTDKPCVYVDVDGEWKTAECNQTISSACMRSTGTSYDIIGNIFQISRRHWNNNCSFSHSQMCHHQYQVNFQEYVLKTQIHLMLGGKTIGCNSRVTVTYFSRKRQPGQMLLLDVLHMVFALSRLWCTL